MRRNLISSTSLFVIIIMVMASLMVAAQPPTNSGERTYNTRTPEWTPIKTFSTTVQIDAGEKFYIKLDNETIQLEPMPPVDLPDECDQALTMVPEWLVDNLTYKFRQIGQSRQIELANQIINSPDPKYRDEIAFCIAHTSYEALQSQYFFPGLLTENAQYIYQNDQYLDYVEIVEKSDYTTLSYKNKTEVALELPRDIYYWYVVHPKLSDDLPTYVDPDHDYTADPPINERNYGVAPPTGKFWRNWLFYENDTGYPLLKDYLSNCSTVWDAISKCSHWVKDSMSFTSNQERPVQPVRIYRKHIGRCGEHQDIANAAARAALVPTTCTLNAAEDHVWNEFWDQRWIRWDANSKDNIDNWNYDKDMGGGKDCSTIWNTRGDSHTWSVLSRYSNTCTLTLNVKDSAGLPVDGAELWVLTQNFYDETQLSITTWGTSDYTGACTFELGNVRDYWACAESDNLGEDPPDQGGNERVTQLITNSNSGGSYSHTFNLPQAAPSLPATAAPLMADPLNKYRMEVSYSVEANILQAINVFSGEHADLYGPGGNIDFFITDDYNYDEYDAGRAFEAYELDVRNSDQDLSVVLPTDDNWYTVLSNEFAQRTTKIVNVTVKLYSTLIGKITAPENNAELELDDTVTISGLAFSPLGITGVELDFDDENDWQSATDASGGTGAPWDTWKFMWDTKGFTPGAHNIRARILDNQDSILKSINVTLIDVTNPTIGFNTPLNNTEFKIGEVITFNGPAGDNVGITTLDLILDNYVENGVNIISSYDSGVWFFELYTDEMTDSEHTITVQTSDAATNAANSTIYFSLLEVIAPVVSITSPSNNSLIRLDDTFYLRGIATDNKAVTILQIVIDDKEPINITNILNAYSGAWFYELATTEEGMEEGEHIIEVQAYDAVMNFGSAKLYLELDGTPPEVEITKPIGGTIFCAGDEVEIEGTAADNYGIDTVEIIFDKGKPINITKNLISGTRYFYEGNGLVENYWVYDEWDTEDLKTGEHNITVRVIDLKGHQRQTSVIILIDAKVPEAELQEILESVLIGGTITLTGTASDDIEVVGLELIIGDEEPINITSNYINGSWSYDWNSSDMLEGDLKVTLKVIDIVGKEGTDEITIKLISYITDSDEDGIPDWWELKFGLNPNKYDSDRDKDRDGVTNLQEYLGDDGLPDNDDYSNPTDEASAPELKKSPAGKEDDLTIIWVVLVIVVIVIVLLILFMTLKKKKADEEAEEAAEKPQLEHLQPDMMILPTSEAPSAPMAPFPMMFQPPPMTEPTPPQPPQQTQPMVPMVKQPAIKTMGPVPQLKSGPPGSSLSLPPAGKTADTKEELEADEATIILAATMAQSAFDKIEAAKDQDMDTKGAEKYLKLSRKAFKSKNYNKALEYAGKSNDEVSKLNETDEEEEE